MAKTNDLIVNTKPKSSFSEAVRTIRTNLKFSSIDKEIKVILNTSPQPRDGKSFISANLAVAYAQDDKKVLIIDCDMRKGTQERIFGVRAGSTGGYSNLILNYDSKMAISKYIIHTSIENVHLIPAGPVPPNPIELLSSKNNEDIINELKTKYDIIILDCPPVLELSDAIVMTKFSDANILVISCGRTKLEELEEAKKAFERANKQITGVVINKDTTKASHEYGYGYYTSE